MRISPRGLELIRQYEGFSARPYMCPAGYRTIGYGHVIKAGEAWQTVDEATATEILDDDVRVSEHAVAQLIHVPLEQGQWDALVSFTFNLGAGALQRSTLRRVINREEHDAVPDQLMRWVFAGGRKLPGLVRRRAAEGRVYQGFSLF